MADTNLTNTARLYGMAKVAQATKDVSYDENEFINANFTVTDKKHSDTTDGLNGFDAATYTNKVTGEIVISFGATDGNQDALEGVVGVFLNIQPEDWQIDQARKYVAQVIAENPNAVITLVGHSLGGVLAQHAAQKGVSNLYTINSPGVNGSTVVNAVQDVAETAVRGFSAKREDGLNHGEAADKSYLQEQNSHGIKVFHIKSDGDISVFSALGEKLDGTEITVRVDPALNEITKHEIDPVLDGLVNQYVDEVIDPITAENVQKAGGVGTITLNSSVSSGRTATDGLWVELGNEKSALDVYTEKHAYLYADNVQKSNDLIAEKKFKKAQDEMMNQYKVIADNGLAETANKNTQMSRGVTTTPRATQSAGSVRLNQATNDGMGTRFQKDIITNNKFAAKSGNGLTPNTHMAGLGITAPAPTPARGTDTVYLEPATNDGFGTPFQNDIDIGAAHNHSPTVDINTGSGGSGGAGFGANRAATQAAQQTAKQRAKSAANRKENSLSRGLLANAPAPLFTFANPPTAAPIANRKRYTLADALLGEEPEPPIIFSSPQKAASVANRKENALSRALLADAPAPQNTYISPQKAALIAALTGDAASRRGFQRD